MAYSSQGSHTGQLDYRNWLVDDHPVKYKMQQNRYKSDTAQFSPGLFEFYNFDNNFTASFA